MLFLEKSKRIRRNKSEKELKKRKTKKKKKVDDLYSLDNATLEAMLDAVAEQDSTDQEINLDSLQDIISGLKMTSDSDSEEESSSEVTKTTKEKEPKKETDTIIKESLSAPTSPQNTFRKRSSAVCIDSDSLRRSTSKVVPTRKGANLGTSALSRVGRRRPDLNREQLSALPKTPDQDSESESSSPMLSPTLQRAQTVNDLEEAKKQKDLQKASVNLRKKLLRDSTISSSSLYRARRCSVMNHSKTPLSAVQVEVENIRSRSSTISGNQIDYVNSEKKKLVDLFEKTLSDPWRLDLFRRFLQEKHKDNMLNFYDASKQFSLSVKQVEALELEPTSIEYLHKRNQLRSEGRQICSRFITDSSFPKQVRCMLKESSFPLLSYIQIPDSSDSECKEDFDEFYCDTDTLSGSDFTESSSDSEELDFFVPELDSESMLLLGTDDPKLLRRSYSSIKPHLFTPKASNSKKIIESFCFFLPERKIYSTLLDDLFSEFLCSHNQVYNMSRTYSEPSPPDFDIINDENNNQKSKEKQKSKSPPKVPPRLDKQEEQSSSNEPEIDIEYSKTESGVQIIDACTFKKAVEIITTSGIISLFFFFLQPFKFNFNIFLI